MEPIITIIVPVYNGEAFIETCINSIFKQTLKDLQIVVVDDGSTDSTGDILDRLQSTDKRMEVIHQPNGGVSNARNTGLSKIKGKWVIFIDSDDYIEPDYCNTMVTEAENVTADVLIAHPVLSGVEKVKLIEDRNRLIQACFSFDEVSFPYNIDAPWGKIFRADLILDHNIRFPETLKRSEDAWFCICVYEAAQKVAVLNQCGYCHVEREGSLCRSFSADAMDVLESVLVENKKLIKRFHADDAGYWKAFYYRVMPGIGECERSYFLHPENKNSLSKNLSAYQKLLNQPMVRESIHNLGLSDVSGRQYKVRLILYKLHMGWLFLLLKANGVRHEVFG